MKIYGSLAAEWRQSRATEVLAGGTGWHVAGGTGSDVPPDAALSIRCDRTPVTGCVMLHPAAHFWREAPAGCHQRRATMMRLASWCLDASKAEPRRCRKAEIIVARVAELRKVSAMSDHATNQPHSAEFFNAMREFWWNLDFLQLMAQRLDFAKVASLLDVGCGLGHWTRALAQVLPATTRFCGVDMEPEWVKGAAVRAAPAGLATRSEFVQGNATALPFADSSFDMVTCQTVLIHVADPAAALREMLRVVRPGGLVLAVEPCNMASISVVSSVTDSFPTDVVAATLRFHLMLQQGKRALGRGFNSLGDLLPGLMAAAGATNIQVYMSDRAAPTFPPYTKPHQQAELAQWKDWHARGHWIWDRATTLENYIAGGGDEASFEPLWQQAGHQMAAEIAAMEAGTFHCANPHITYLVSGQKL